MEAETHLIVPKNNSASGMKYTPPEGGEDREEPSPVGPVESGPTIREDASGDVPVLFVRVSECVSEARGVASVATGGECVDGAGACSGRESEGLELEATPDAGDRLEDRCGEVLVEEGPAAGGVAFAGVGVEVLKRRHAPGAHATGHARFLQHLFRGYARLRPGAWGRSGGLMGCPMPRRPVTTFRCKGGRCLAGLAEYASMKLRARELMDWQNLYVRIYQKLRKSAPRSYHPYAAAGADGVGVRAAGGVPFGADIAPQPCFERMFGEGSFSVADATDRADFLQRVGKVKPMVILASPPCKKYSTMDVPNHSEAEELIALTRDACEQTGKLYVIENVKGAAAEMKEHAILLYGAYFGLQVDRPRFFEANFELRVDEYLKVPGLALRKRGCLGPRRKWRRMDPFGRPELLECCEGTLYPIQGLRPVGFTHEEGARAMGLEPDHMPFERMAQAIPPAARAA